MCCKVVQSMAKHPKLTRISLEVGTLSWHHKDNLLSFLKSGEAQLQWAKGMFIMYNTTKEFSSLLSCWSRDIPATKTCLTSLNIGYESWSNVFKLFLLLKYYFGRWTSYTTTLVWTHLGKSCLVYASVWYGSPFSRKHLIVKRNLSWRRLCK